MDYSLVIAQIIKEQKDIIGPLAIKLAGEVNGVVIVDLDKNKIDTTRDGRVIVHDLVRAYAQYFGMTSVEVCKEVIKRSSPTATLEDMSVMFDNVLE